MSHDWSQFTQKIKIKASVPTLYKAWATRDGLESWFLRMAEFRRDGQLVAHDALLQAGDTYHWRWHGWPDTVEEFGEVLEANNKDRFKFVFGKAGVVTVTFEDLGNGITEMTIHQGEIPTTEEGKANYHVGCSSGWTFYRCNLKSLMQGGIDIRNKENTTDMND